MPAITTTIDRDQREGLYELVRNHLGSIEDFWVALERTRDFAKVERLGLEFAEDFRLLQDIGWGEEEARERFELTMAPHDLMEVLKRLRGEAVGILVESRSEADASHEDAETNRRFQLGYQACEKALADLDSRGPYDEPPPALGDIAPMSSPHPADSANLAAPAAQDIEDQRAVLAFLVEKHPAQLTISEVAHALYASPGDFKSEDAVERAIRDLVGGGLLHCHGSLVLPTRAALYFARLGME